MTKDEIAEVEQYRQAAFSLLSAEQQYQVAFLIAENIGYVLTKKKGMTNNEYCPVCGKYRGHASHICLSDEGMTDV